MQFSTGLMGLVVEFSDNSKYLGRGVRTGRDGNWIDVPQTVKDGEALDTVRAILSGTLIRPVCHVK